MTDSPDILARTEHLREFAEHNAEIMRLRAELKKAERARKWARHVAKLRQEECRVLRAGLEFYGRNAA